jgi:hypothetical protein
MKNKETLADRLLRYFKKNPGIWITGGHMEKLVMNIGKKGSTGSRTLRLMAEEGDLLAEEKILDGGKVKTVHYKLNPEKHKRVVYTAGDKTIAVWK